MSNFDSCCLETSANNPKCVLLGEFDNCLILVLDILIYVSEWIKLETMWVRSSHVEKTFSILTTWGLLTLKHDVIHCCWYIGVYPKMAIHYVYGAFFQCSECAKQWLDTLNNHTESDTCLVFLGVCQSLCFPEWSKRSKMSVLGTFEHHARLIQAKRKLVCLLTLKSWSRE